MTSKQYDVVVVGCGIAGATIAWQLHWQKKSILVIDDQAQSSASNAAAGVISPITGKRHTNAWRWQEFWPEARTFYEKVESVTGKTLLRTIPQLRFPLYPISDQVFKRASAVANLNGLSASEVPQHIQPEIAQHGILEVENGVLDVKLFLQATYDMLKAHHRLDGNKLTYKDIEVKHDNISISNLNATAKHIVFCEGAQGESNPWFGGTHFETVKGESLIVNIEQLPKDKIYHYGISLVPMSNNNFYAGATYDWRGLNSGITELAKQDLEISIGKMTTSPFETLAHQSGIRPVIRGRKPVILQHAQFQDCWFFNGLASSGCLQAPLLAKQMCNAILMGSFTQTDVGRVSTKSPVESNGKPRLTARAHQLVSDLLKTGDSAIDATAGNGNDTKFLAERVGALGRVFAFDIQPVALERSAKRVAKLPYQNVEFKLADHGKLAAIIPDQFHGEIAVVMFNLGYLPGSEGDLITLPSSTCRAIRSALTLIRKGGACTVLCYRGHAGGQEEFSQVSALLDSLDSRKFDIEIFGACHDDEAPILYRVTKLTS